MLFSFVLCSTIHSERLAVRLDFDIPTQEKEFLKKRSVVVAQALEKLFGAQNDPKKVECFIFVTFPLVLLSTTGVSVC